MAVTTTITSATNSLKPVKQAATPGQNFGTVQTKSISFTVPTGTSTNGYYTGDTLLLKNMVPKGVEVTGVWVKLSADQGGTLTFAPRLYTAADTGRTAFVTARTLNLTAGVVTSLVVVPGTGSVNTIATADSDIAILLAGTTVGTTAGTITLTLQLTSVDAASADYTTYSI